MTATNDFEMLRAVNESQIAELKKAGAELDPAADCEVFRNHVRNVQAAVLHTYQITAWQSLRETDPRKASQLWKELETLCDGALTVLKNLKGIYPSCGAPQLYDLALDYKLQAQKRYFQNLQDSECQTIPAGLFPKTK
jgi:hypothetical protein